ncbi:HAD-IB family phosphatase [Aeromonas veronii]|uniref:HAD-IB family phosphatase n=1 Tax=Aeromonas veronii TaxID=654 RepID=UPI003B97E47E
MKKLFLVDICGTLYRENTTFLFLDNFLGSSDRCITRKNIALKIINKIMLVFFRFDLIKFYSLKRLKGISQETLYVEAAKICRSKLTENIGIHQFIDLKKQDGYDIVLVSATIDPVASYISSSLGIRCISSQLKYDNDKCLGVLEDDIFFTKHKKVSDLLLKYDLVEMITDNKTDLPLCQKCNRFYGVSYSKKDAHFWSENGAYKVYEL